MDRDKTEGVGSVSGLGLLGASLALLALLSACTRGSERTADRGPTTTLATPGSRPTRAATPTTKATEVLTSMPEPEPTVSPTANSTSTAPAADEWRPWRSEVFTIGTVDPTLPPEKAEIIEAYFAFREAYLEAELAPEVDPYHPGLAAYAVDPVLAGVQERLEGYVESDILARLPEGTGYEVFARVALLNGDEARLNVCDVNDVVLYRRSGEIVNDLVSVRPIEADMRRVDGKWFIAGHRYPDAQEVDGCIVQFRRP